ncbi:DNRLRE domain-containing protein [Candidatus Woesebacteria bacterium]|nr:MAG: DNRLRE domain-containing protein [Candidatus Woesebacteria bacterium]
MDNISNIPQDIQKESSSQNLETTTKPMATKVTLKNKFSKILIITPIIIVIILISYASFTYGRLTAPQIGKNARITEDEKSDAVEVVTQGLTPQPKPTRTEIPLTQAPEKPTVTKIVLGQADLDGYMASDGIGYSDKEIRIGRDSVSVTRGFVSFDLTVIPTGVTVKAASLRLYQIKTTENPYATIGDLRLDHLNYGDSLDAQDYSLPAFVSNFATISTSKNIGWKEADVTNAVRDDFANGRGQSQFRIHFGKETLGENKSGDFVYFISSEQKGSVNRPQLVIEYY